MRQHFVCKIAYPVEASIPDTFFYTFGYLIPVSDMDEVEAVVITACGLRIRGHRQPPFPPYDWCFQFVGVPLNESCKLVVVARDALGRTSRDVTNVVLSFSIEDPTITISSPPPLPSPSSVATGVPFATWGLITDTSLVGSMTATIVSGSTTLHGTLAQAPPPAFNWQFNFAGSDIPPASLKGHTGELTVSAPGAPDAKRDLKFT